MIMVNNVWNIEILEKYVEIRGLENVYIQYHRRSSTNPDLIWPVKTRLNQNPPSSDQRVVLLLEGSHLVQGYYIGKALFEMKPGETYNFGKINYNYLIDNRELATYEEEDAVPVDNAQFVQVSHNGWCGYNAVGQSLGFPVNPEDVDSVGKKVIKKMIESGYDFKCTVPDDILESDTLDSKFWLTSDASKFSCSISSFYSITTFLNNSENIGSYL